MKIEALYSQGVAPYREDGLVVNTELFGVLDGGNAPYAPNYPPKMFNGLSGGEMVARLCERFSVLSPANNLRQFILEMNAAVGKEQAKAGISLDDAGELAGAAFAFAYIKEDQIQIAQAGDCLAVVELRTQQIVVTPNQIRLHEIEMNAEVERLQREIAQDLFGLSLEKVPANKRQQVRNEMWNRFYHTFREARRHDANNLRSSRRYGFLNGQPQLADLLWEHSFNHAQISTILLFSDGIVPWTLMKSLNDQAIGLAALAEFKRQGLAGLLLSARGIEKKNVTTAYIDHAEATAVAIEF